MPPSGSQHYDALPQVPSYDEAISLQPARSPIDDRDGTEIEQQSLLSNAASGPSGGRPGGYRPPTVETDDESHLESDNSTNSEEELRREMHNFDVEEPDSTAHTWGKRIRQWRWKWRLRMPTMTFLRLGGGEQPPGIEASASSRSNGRLAEEGRAVGDSEPDSATPSRWFSEFFPGSLALPRLEKTTVFLLIARVTALTMFLGFFYILFLSDVFSGMARRMESHAFPPEVVRHEVQKSVNWRRMQSTLKEFTSYAHVAGTEGDFSLAEDIEGLLRGYGLEEVAMSEYYVYLNYPGKDRRAVRLLDDDRKTVKWTAKLEEPELGGEKAGHQTFVFHGYSKSGEAMGPLVYANYGSREDFSTLKDIGIKTEGAIALIRYHGTQPNVGLKVKAAEMAGFVGCLIYTDPADNGFSKTQEAPEGRSMPADGVQRGSVALMPWVLGDPLTPGWESSKNLPRMKPEDSPGLVKIPSLPLSANDAMVLLQSIKGLGKKVPEEWKGSVPAVEYWTGSDTSPIVQLINDNDEVERQPIWNVLGKVIGAEKNHKVVIIGSHRDAWATGATSPGSGTAIFLELARIFGLLLNAGWRPRRTIIFASWDAETYNMVGSTEFVEHHLKTLQEDGYAYINLDNAVSGDVFEASGSPVFQMPLMRALGRVSNPHFNASLRDLWDESGSEIRGPDAEGDDVPFQELAGMSSLDVGFRSQPYPKHSSYDNFHWMDNVADPMFTYHTLLGQVVGLLILELSDEPILPFDIHAYAASLEKWVSELESWAKGKGSDKRENGFRGFDAMTSAAVDISDSVGSVENWELRWQTAVVGGGGWESAGLSGERHAHNNKLARFETALLDLGKEGGLPGRKQYKHVVFGSQKWGAYEEAYFPGIRDAIDEGDWALANLLVDKTADIMRAAADVLSPRKDKKRHFLWQSLPRMGESGRE